MTPARRVLLSGAELAVLAGDLPLPPGFDDVGHVPPAVRHAALSALTARGLAPDGQPHPALRADLHRLARPQVAVLLGARRPGLEVDAVLALAGGLGTSLLRTGGDSVRLSAFAATALAEELAGVVPAAVGRAPLRHPEVLPLAELLRPGPGPAQRLHEAWSGALRLEVVGPGGAVLAVVEAAWLQHAGEGGWALLEPAGRAGSGPLARLRPVLPLDLAAAAAPAVAQALAA